MLLIAPATANTIAKMANGVCDNLLLTTYMSARCQVVVAPAMDMDMYAHKANQKNIETLKSYGNLIVEPASGELASGLQGKGRMEEPENIVKFIIDYFEKGKRLKNKHFVVTAGPTYEPIDSVRFIGNYSSGKMAYAIAETLAQQGAKVTLVSGPVSITLQHKNIEIQKVTTAAEMYAASVNCFEKTDGAILCAAVSDFTPDKTFDYKMKRGNENLSLTLKPTNDIAAQLGKLKRPNQLLVGFALETNNELENARQKLHKKNLDFIVLNSLNDKGAGFQHDTNKITIIDKLEQIQEFQLKSKHEVALDIVEKIYSFIK